MDPAINGTIMSFTFLSTELILECFCHCPSFNEVFALAATCRRTRNIWTQHVGIIYNHVAPNSIPCERHAYALHKLAMGKRGSLSPHDVVAMVRNATKVESAVSLFENQCVKRF